VHSADVSTAAPPRSRLPVVLLAATTAALVVSGINPYDGPTWWLEVFPILAAIPILVLTRRRFPLTSLTYVLLSIHALILMVGGHYTYALVPAGDWVKDALHLSRNPYDRLGHLAQGFVPAILAREVLLRTSPLRRGGWLFTVVTAMCLAISALYELVEWLTAIVMGGGATDFLGTQGDPWDTQWDMFCAWIGAMAAQLLIARLHDRQMARIESRAGARDQTPSPSV
jgi:putative membrane protein